MIEYRWPLNIRPKESVFTLLTQEMTSSSPFRVNVQTTSPLVEQWMAEITWDVVREDDWPEVVSMIRRLRGRTNALRIPDFRRQLPRGVAAGKYQDGPVTQAAFSDGTSFSDGTGWTDQGTLGTVSQNAVQGQDSILISGLVPNQAKSVDFADMMEIGGYLYESLVKTASDSTGRARVVICPPLRENVPSGTSVLFENATTPFQLMEGSDIKIASFARGRHMNPFSLKLIEIIP